MTVAPDLFDPKHALGALHVAHKALLGPLGVKTLDASDPDYRPNYDNSNDSDDWHVAKGRNVSLPWAASMPQLTPFPACSTTRDL